MYHTKKLPETPSKSGYRKMTQLKNLSKNIVQRSCENHCWKNAIGKGAHLISCQTMAKQTGCQKQRQRFKTKESVSMCYLETYREDAIQNTVKLLRSENPCQNARQKNWSKVLPKTPVKLR